jgi:hypothetical protein
MNGFVKLMAVVLIGSGLASASDKVAKALESAEEATLKADPSLPFWQQAPVVKMQRDIDGKRVSKFAGEARIRWTKNNLYILITCPYETLYLKPDPKTSEETNELWNWDVAEAFIGSDFNDIKKYKEFEVSPRGEWVDLDIDLKKPRHEDGWVWNSGFEVAAETDANNHIWYAAMKIPYSALDSRPAAAGNKLRLNLYRSQGPADNHFEVTWQPPKTKTFHAPEKFGTLLLISK